MPREGIKLEPNTDLYNAIVTDIMDNQGLDNEEVTDEMVFEFVTSIAWHALESR